MLSLLQNSSMNVRFRFYYFFLFASFTLIVSMKRRLASCSSVLFFCCLFLTLFFSLNLDIIVRFIYLAIIKLHSYDARSRLGITMDIVYYKFCDALTDSLLSLVSQFHKQFTVSDLLFLC